MNTKELKITIPEGYEIDESLSTFSNIVFKPVIKKESAEERMTAIWKSCNNVKYSSNGCRTYFKDDIPMIQQDWTTKKLYYNYKDIYLVFENDYKMNETQINNLLLSTLSKDLNVIGLAGVTGGRGRWMGRVAGFC
jgi:hypothetical protein